MIGDSTEENISVVQSLAYEVKVEQVCVKNLITVGLRDKMSELRSTLQAGRISGTPVMDGDRLVGLISIEDLLKCLQAGKIDDPISVWMNKDVKVVYADETVVQAISKFNKWGFGRFPVIERGTERLVGILTKGDIIKGLLKRLESTYLGEEIHRIRASHIFEDMLADEVTLNFSYTVEAGDFDKAGTSSINFKKTLNRLGIAPDIVRRVSIATYEAEINIVVYSAGGRIAATVQPDRIMVTAEDSGPGIPDIEQAMKPGYSTAPEWVRAMGFGAGMGLCNIKKCADEMHLTSEAGKGTTLKFIVYLNRKGQG